MNKEKIEWRKAIRILKNNSTQTVIKCFLGAKVLTLKELSAASKIPTNVLHDRQLYYLEFLGLIEIEKNMYNIYNRKMVFSFERYAELEPLINRKLWKLTDKDVLDLYTEAVGGDRASHWKDDGDDVLFLCSEAVKADRASYRLELLKSLPILTNQQVIELTIVSNFIDKMKTEIERFIAGVRLHRGNCKSCGISFVLKKASQTFCSIGCYQKDYQKEYQRNRYRAKALEKKNVN
jgi:hypothetical protein